MAMQACELPHTVGQRYSSTSHTLAASQDMGAYNNTVECKDGYASLVDFCMQSLGLNAGKPVLLPASHGCASGRSLRVVGVRLHVVPRPCELPPQLGLGPPCPRSIVRVSTQVRRDPAHYSHITARGDQSLDPRVRPGQRDHEK